MARRKKDSGSEPSEGKPLDPSVAETSSGQSVPIAKTTGADEPEASRKTAPAAKVSNGKSAPPVSKAASVDSDPGSEEGGGGMVGVSSWESRLREVYAHTPFEDKIERYSKVLNANIKFTVIFTLMVFSITLIFTMKNLRDFKVEQGAVSSAREQSILELVSKNRLVTDYLGTPDSEFLREKQFVKTLVGEFDNVLAASLVEITDRGPREIDSYTARGSSEILTRIKTAKNGGITELYPEQRADVIRAGKFVGKITLVFTREASAKFWDRIVRISIFNGILVILFSLAAGHVLSLMLSTPTERIAANIDFIGRGHFNQYITEKRIGPEGRLIASVNTLLKAFNDEIRGLVEKSVSAREHLSFMLQSAIDEIPDGAVLISEENTVAVVNRAFTRAFGFKAESVLGKHFFELFNDKDTVAAIREVRLKSFENKSRSSFSIILVPCQGQTARFRLTVKSFEAGDLSRVSLVIFKFIDNEKTEA